MHSSLNVPSRLFVCILPTVNQLLASSATWDSLWSATHITRVWQMRKILVTLTHTLYVHNIPASVLFSISSLI